MIVLKTRRGEVPLPTYVPVTTFGNKYPLDKLIQPYLPRLASAMMVSYSYAKDLDHEPALPLFVDSGGFASLFEKSRIEKRGRVAVLKVATDDGFETIHPRDVLELQERIADVAFTLDFPVPPGTNKRQANRRKKLTIENAAWALDNRRRKDMLLFGCIQAWDAQSAEEVASEYATMGFDGIAIGGLVPRAKDTKLIVEIVSAVRNSIPKLPLHVFGIGKPDTVKRLFELGVDSVDSSSYIKQAANGRTWEKQEIVLNDASIPDRLHLALRNLASAVGHSNNSKSAFTSTSFWSQNN